MAEIKKFYPRREFVEDTSLNTAQNLTKAYIAFLSDSLKEMVDESSVKVVTNVDQTTANDIKGPFMIIGVDNLASTATDILSGIILKFNYQITNIEPFDTSDAVLNTYAKTNNSTFFVMGGIRPATDTTAHESSGATFMLSEIATKTLALKYQYDKINYYTNLYFSQDYYSRYVSKSNSFLFNFVGKTDSCVVFTTKYSIDDMSDSSICIIVAPGVAYDSNDSNIRIYESYGSTKYSEISSYIEPASYFHGYTATATMKKYMVNGYEYADIYYMEGGINYPTASIIQIGACKYWRLGYNLFYKIS